MAQVGRFEVMARTNLRNNADIELFERQARICRAFAHRARLQILDRLGHGELGVSDLQEALGISKANISQHLAVLKSVGVVSTRREGKQVYCSLAMPEVKQACHLIRKVLQCNFFRIALRCCVEPAFCIRPRSSSTLRGGVNRLS